MYRDYILYVHANGKCWYYTGNDEYSVTQDIAKAYLFTLKEVLTKKRTLNENVSFRFRITTKGTVEGIPSQTMPYFS